MNKRIVFWLVFAVFSGLPFLNQAMGLDSALLEKTVISAKAHVVPANEVKIIYEPLTEHLYISFVTPPDYKGSSADSYRRWRSNQWSVLQEFMLSRIPVKFVSVETNDLENQRLIRYTHTNRHVDKYGDIHENRLWLKTAVATQKRPNSDTWEKLD